MYEYKVKQVLKVIDGDTIDVDIDLGFDISYTQRVRLAGIDTPESRTLDAKEKVQGLLAKEYLKHTLENAKSVVIKTEKSDSTEKYGRILGWLFINSSETSINAEMIARGYAWAYDGGTKKKDFDALDKIRLANR